MWCSPSSPCPYRCLRSRSAAEELHFAPPVESHHPSTHLGRGIPSTATSRIPPPQQYHPNFRSPSAAHRSPAEVISLHQAPSDAPRGSTKFSADSTFVVFYRKPPHDVFDGTAVSLGGKVPTGCAGWATSGYHAAGTSIVA